MLTIPSFLHPIKLPGEIYWLKKKRKMNVKGASMNDTHLTGITCMEGEG